MQQIAVKKLRVIDMTYIALFSILIVICSWISIPLTIPFTLQTFAIFCSLAVLGGRKGTFAIVIYILLGLIGLPVFAGFKGGFGILLGPTGGYVLGFLLSGLIYLAITSQFAHSLIAKTIAMTLGLLVCYAFGTLWFIYVYGHSTGSIGLVTALSWCVFPFILPDLIKIILALGISQRIKPFVHI